VLVSVHHSHYQALRGELVALRKAAGLSQVQLAERLGVGQSYISKIERGEAYVDVLAFVDWCQACGVGAGHTLAQLFDA
jgi:transcriptional regulator with XRE-family HTH domain